MDAALKTCFLAPYTADRSKICFYSEIKPKLTFSARLGAEFSNVEMSQSNQSRNYRRVLVNKDVATLLFRS